MEFTDYSWIIINALLVITLLYSLIFTGEFVFVPWLAVSYWSFQDALENGL